MDKLNEISALKSLSRKQDIRITPHSKKIILLSSDSRYKRNDLGGGSYGKIDYLVNYRGYKILKVEKFINFNQRTKKIGRKKSIKLFSGK